MRVQEGFSLAFEFVPYLSSISSKNIQLSLPVEFMCAANVCGCTLTLRRIIAEVIICLLYSNVSVGRCTTSSSAMTIAAFRWMWCGTLVGNCCKPSHVRHGCQCFLFSVVWLVGESFVQLLGRITWVCLCVCVHVSVFLCRPQFATAST